MRRMCRYFQERGKVPQKRNITHALAFPAPGNLKHWDEDGHYGYRQM